MAMKTLLSLSLLLTLAAAGCTSEAKTEPVDPAKNDAPLANQTAAVIHDVKCGCSIDGIGRCGNYIMIDGNYVPLVHPSLGKMEFCSQKAAGAKIETKGAMKDGKFVAETWKLIE